MTHSLVTGLSTIFFPDQDGKGPEVAALPPTPPPEVQQEALPDQIVPSQPEDAIPTPKDPDPAALSSAGEIPEPEKPPASCGKEIPPKMAASTYEAVIEIQDGCC